MNTLRLPASALALVLLFAAARGPAFAEPIEVHARTVPLNEEVPEQTTVGALRYRGGLLLTSPDARFGGLSALAVTVDGQQFLALSDRGFRFTARLVYDERGDLAGVRGAELGAMSGLDGRALSGLREADAESLAPAPRGRSSSPSSVGTGCGAIFPAWRCRSPCRRPSSWRRRRETAASRP